VDTDFHAFHSSLSVEICENPRPIYSGNADINDSDCSDRYANLIAETGFLPLRLKWPVGFSIM